MNDKNNVLLMTLAGLMTQQYLEIINFQNLQIKTLKSLFKSAKIPLNDDQRRILASEYIELEKTLSF
jgi:hypothetical protein